MNHTNNLILNIVSRGLGQRRNFVDQVINEIRKQEERGQLCSFRRALHLVESKTNISEPKIYTNSIAIDDE